MLALPPWLDPEAWAGFVEMRKKIKKPMTDRAERLILAKLDEMRGRGHSPNDALDESTVQCWAGVFEPKGSRTVAAAPRSFRQADTEARNERYAAMTGQTVKPAGGEIIDMQEVRDVRRLG